MRTVIRNNPVASVIIMAVVTAVFCSACLAWGLNERRQADERIKQSQEVSNVAIYGLSYALSEEQAKAGNLEVGSLNWKEQAKLWESRARKAWGEQGPMTQQIEQQSFRICRLEQMLRDNGVRLYQRSECER